MRAILAAMVVGFGLFAGPVWANSGETAAAEPAAEAQVAPEAAPEVAAEAAPAKKGLFALFSTDPATKAARDTARAERKAARLAAREARKAARLARSSGNTDVASRADVKQGVEFALDNKPKGRWWCVPFARMVSGLELRGNAKTWWEQAKGRYTRSTEPKVGAVMAFAASRAMPKGHVAVVSDVVSDREILVVQANWTRGKVTLDDRVIDVSEAGDWSVVRVENHAESLGRANPVNGFIYAG